jgi:hypothetical protein
MWLRVGLVLAMLVPSAQASTQVSNLDVTSAAGPTAAPVVEVADGPNRRASTYLHALHDRHSLPCSLWVEDLLALEAVVEAGPEDWTSELSKVVPTIAWAREPFARIHAFDRVLSVDRGHLVVSTRFGRGPPLA